MILICGAKEFNSSVVISASIWRVHLVVVGVGSPIDGVFTLTLAIIIFG
jgi:hypothetical protein